MKNCAKILLYIIVFISCIILLQTISLAEWKPVDEIGNAENSWGNNVGDGGLIKSTQNIVGTVINVIRIVGTGIAIIMLTYIAIKYMSAAPSEKAEFKKSATGMIVGAIVLFAASNILQVIANFANKNIVTG